MVMNSLTMTHYKMKDRSTSSLRTLISDSTNPVFIVDTDMNLVVSANNAARLASRSGDPEGAAFSSLVSIEQDGRLAFYGRKWFILKKEEINWNHEIFSKVTLKQHASIPDEHTLFTIRNMIAVLVHRLRSPMTGMQGYLEMLGHIEEEKDQRKLSKVQQGLDYLFEIMDELELLHHAGVFIEDEADTERSNAESVLRNIIFTFGSNVRNRIKITNHSTGNFRFNESELKQILTLLVDNAVEHTSGAGSPIEIDIHSSRKISVTNAGATIPGDIADTLYFPFVTTKANNLGIGLSLAQLIANRRHAIIMLTENSSEHGIEFTLLCAPAAESAG